MMPTDGWLAAACKMKAASSPLVLVLIARKGAFKRIQCPRLAGVPLPIRQ
jgi:hypothetical protein